MLRSPILALALAGALAMGPGPAVDTPAAASPHRSHTLVVDDDGAQCGPHAYSSIQAGVNAARPGDRVRVCPGRYAERVVVNKPLALTGQPAAVAALDCFTEQISEPDDLNSTLVPVLEPPDAEETPVLRLNADRIEVAGLVIQGVDDQEPDVVGDGYQLIDAALTTDDAHTGWRVHHNLFRLNFLAVELGSKGGREARFDHNCLRDNYYAVANQRYTLSRARLDHNETYRSEGTAWEIGWGYRGTTAVTLHRNTARQDHLAVSAENDDRLTIQGNLVEQAGIGINLAGGLAQTTIVDNTVTKTTAGAAVTVNPRTAGSPVTGLVIRGNTVTDNAFSGFTTGGLANLTGGSLVANTFSRNQRSGIALAPGTRAVRVLDNVTDGNVQYGIRLFAGTQDNLLLRNRMLGNGLADAVDESAVTTDGVTVLANRWVRSTCTVDVPTGEICWTS